MKVVGTRRVPIVVFIVVRTRRVRTTFDREGRIVDLCGAKIKTGYQRWGGSCTATQFYRTHLSNTAPRNIAPAA